MLILARQRAHNRDANMLTLAAIMFAVPELKRLAHESMSEK